MRALKSAVLVIIDGWGIRAEKKWNAIAQANTPHYDRILKEYPNSSLQASGLPVGLPAGVMGNSEVGHMNIGAGRRVVQDQVRIYESIEDGTFLANKTLFHEIDAAKKRGNKLHLIGLVSQGSVHSAEKHYLSLIELVSRRNFPKDRLFVHAFLDGRDTPPKSAAPFLETLEKSLRKFGGKIATISGRFYAMDRDRRWERTQLALDAMVSGKGEKAKEARDALQIAYERGESDEFVLPTVIEQAGKIESGDSIICFNFRPDRMRQLVTKLKDLKLKLSLVTFTEYDKTFGLPVAFAPQNIIHCLGEVISLQGLKQFRTAETEKYAHVTYFLNGGRELPFPGEERLMIPSPKVKTYDLTPEMSSKEVTTAVTDRIGKKSDSLIVVNFAHPDMVGHTGVWEAAVAAVESTDRSLGAIMDAAMDQSFWVFITADHGNVELMKDPQSGEPHTAHTTNPVPFIVAGKEIGRGDRLSNGALCDVAPTILHSIGLVLPSEMTGKNLLKLI